jgi:hypothetical protein
MPDDREPVDWDSERDRMERRQAVRDRIARRELLKQKLAMVEQRLADFDREADAAAEAHRVATEPLQAELKRIEDRLAAAMANRRPIDQAAEERRRELIGQIEAQNVALADACERIKRLKRAPLDERYKLSERVASESTLERDLTAPPLVNPKLAIENFVRDQTLQWANARFRAAEAKIENHEALAQVADEAKDHQEADMIRARNLRWSAERTLAMKAFAEAKLASDEVYQRMLDE